SCPDSRTINGLPFYISVLSDYYGGAGGNEGSRVFLLTNKGYVINLDFIDSPISSDTAKMLASFKLLGDVKAIRATNCAEDYVSPDNVQKIPDTWPIGSTSGTTTTALTTSLYTDQETGFSFKYPSDWTVSYNSKDRAYILKKTVGNTDLDLSIQFGIDGVGGACPDYNPAVSVARSHVLNFAGQQRYFIYSKGEEGTSQEFAYLSERSDGACPNLPYIRVPSASGLFSVLLLASDDRDTGYKRSTISLDQAGISEKDLDEAEGIISSFKIAQNSSQGVEV